MNPTSYSVELRLFMALALGFLAGMERESTGARSPRGTRVHAGVRTYSILSLFGYGCAWLSTNGFPLALPFGLLAVTSLTVITNVARQRGGHIGFTSEVAAHLTYVVGALCLTTAVWLPLALGISSTVLLSEKGHLENLVHRLERAEFLAILRFLVVTLLILPVLPDQEYTRFGLNPARIWKIVVVISAIGFVGYFLVKKYGPTHGLWLSGVLGGIVSSTAVAVSMGRFARRSPERTIPALQASMLASAVMYVRLLVIFAIVGPAFVRPLWWKLLAMAAVGLVLASTLRRPEGPEIREAEPVPHLINPFEVTPALLFAVLFVVLSVGTTLVRDFFGTAGVVTMAALVGLTDIDPFLLSIVGGGTAPSSP
ncbi:MAG: MgtC/SapB family protein, partial [Candidatus Eisenbacteria bacterium]|nr:MgtC/SapB family protein [Candidatus Eisenbacteria bacterium]